MYSILMSVCHIFEEAHCPYCEVGLIGKVVIYNFPDSGDYLSGIVIIAKYICLHCQMTKLSGNQGFFTLKHRELAHHYHLVIRVMSII